MTITPEQEARTLATEFDYQLQFWVGGQRGHVPEGSVVAWAPFNTGISSTLASAVGPEDTTFTLADGSSFYQASAGAPRTLFVEPSSASEAWERCTYTGKSGNVFTGIVRDRRLVSDVGRVYAHGVGAKIHQWVDVTRYIVPDFELTWSRDGSVAKWATRLQGIKFNRVLFERGNMLICKVRFRVNGSWTDWMVWWAGYIKDSEVLHDFRSANLFAMNVEGVSQFIDNYEISAHHFGKTNLAQDRPVRTSSVLQNVLLEPGGEFFGTPELSGAKAVDGNVATPWVSEFAPRTTPDPDEDKIKGTSFRFTEVYFPPDVYGDDYAWFEIMNPLYPGQIESRPDGSLEFAGEYICNKNTIHAPLRSDITEPTVGPEPYSNFLPLPAITVPSRGYVVFCRNMDSFSEWWAVISGAEVVDWRKTYSYGDGAPQNTDKANNAEFRLDRNGDFLQMRSGNGGNKVIDEVFWGNITSNWHDASKDFYVAGKGWYRCEARWPQRRSVEDPTEVPESVGPNSRWVQGLWASVEGFNYPHAIPEGKSIRRTYTTGWDEDPPGNSYNYAGEWKIEDYPSPGQHFSLPAGEYISVDIGRIPTVLAQDLEPGATSVGVTGGTTGFLPSGAFIVDSEVITYTGKTNDAFTGLGPFSSSHAAGTAVYPVENGQVMTLYPVVELEFLRPNNWPYPKKYAVYGSSMDNPTYPPVATSQADAQKPSNKPTDWAMDWEPILLQGTQAGGSTKVVAVNEWLAEVVVQSTEGFPDSGIFYRRDLSSQRDFAYPYAGKTATKFTGVRRPFPPLNVGDVVFSKQYDSPSSQIVQRFSSPLRYRHYLLFIYEMSDGGRAKVGEIEIYPRDLEHIGGDGQEPVDGTYLKDIVKHLLTAHFDLPASKLSIPSVGDLVVRNLDLQKAMLGDVLRDLARMTGSLVVYQLANGVVWRRDPLFRRGIETETRYIFSRSSCDSPLFLSLRPRHRVSQVELFAENRQTRETFHVYYPPVPRPYGRRLPIYGLQFLGSKAEAQAFAELLFKRENFSTKIQLRLRGIGDWCTPAQKIGVSFSDTPDQVPFFDRIRYYITTGVMWTVRASDPRNKVWLCDITAEEAL